MLYYWAQVLASIFLLLISTPIHCFSTSPFSALTAHAGNPLKSPLCSKESDCSQMSAHYANSHKAAITTIARKDFQKMSLFGLKETKSEHAS